MPLTHIHTYERSQKNPDIYRCLDPNCSHYQNRAYLLGKRALCNKCHQEFILDRTQIGVVANKNSGNKHPVCINCSKSKKAQERRNLTSELLEIFGD